MARRDSIPPGPDGAARIGERLADRGYADEDVRLIMHGNWIRLFAESLPAA